jgi:hypothetical protein
MVSLLLPTRKRPDNLKRFYESAMTLADKPTQIEVIAYVDSDDDSYDFSLPRLRYVRGPRIVLSEMWNKCHEMAVGPIFGHMGDDIVFRNQGWDTLVKDKFKEYPDKIVFVHGDDMSNVHLDRFGTHGFLHQNWVDAVGYFVPPYFSSDYNDTWLNEVANMIGRRVYIDDLKTEHMHFAFNKGDVDITHQERLARHENENVGGIYQGKAAEREADAEKLRRVMQ